MTAYIVECQEKKTTHLSSLIFPTITKLELGSTYNYKDIVRGKNGKPQPIFTKYFNISHCDHYWCIVFSNEECGIDIENSTREINQRLSRRILAKNEESIDDNPLKTWVLKEAYAKYRGEGIGLPFNGFTTDKIRQNYYVNDLSTNDYICFTIQQNQAPIQTIFARWENNTVLL